MHRKLKIIIKMFYLILFKGEKLQLYSFVQSFHIVLTTVHYLIVPLLCKWNIYKKWKEQPSPSSPKRKYWMPLSIVSTVHGLHYKNDQLYDKYEYSHFVITHFKRKYVIYLCLYTKRKIVNLRFIIIFYDLHLIRRKLQINYTISLNCLLLFWWYSPATKNKNLFKNIL